jgi:hypothetical protein
VLTPSQWGVNNRALPSARKVLRKGLEIATRNAYARPSEHPCTIQKETLLELTVVSVAHPGQEHRCAHNTLKELFMRSNA